jgi:hypothetical protein
VTPYHLNTGELVMIGRPSDGIVSVIFPGDHSRNAQYQIDNNATIEINGEEVNLSCLGS